MAATGTTSGSIYTVLNEIACSDGILACAKTETVVEEDRYVFGIGKVAYGLTWHFWQCLIEVGIIAGLWYRDVSSGSHNFAPLPSPVCYGCFLLPAASNVTE